MVSCSFYLTKVFNTLILSNMASYRLIGAALDRLHNKDRAKISCSLKTLLNLDNIV